MSLADATVAHGLPHGLPHGLVHAEVKNTLLVFGIILAVLTCLVTRWFCLTQDTAMTEASDRIKTRQASSSHSTSTRQSSLSSLKPRTSLSSLPPPSMSRQSSRQSSHQLSDDGFFELDPSLLLAAQPGRPQLYRRSSSPVYPSSPEASASRRRSISVCAPGTNPVTSPSCRSASNSSPNFSLCTPASAFSDISLQQLLDEKPPACQGSSSASGGIAGVAEPPGCGLTVPDMHRSMSAHERGPILSGPEMHRSASGHERSSILATRSRPLSRRTSPNVSFNLPNLPAANVAALHLLLAASKAVTYSAPPPPQRSAPTSPTPSRPIHAASSSPLSPTSRPNLRRTSLSAAAPSSLPIAGDAALAALLGIKQHRLGSSSQLVVSPRRAAPASVKRSSSVHDLGSIAMSATHGDVHLARRMLEQCAHNLPAPSAQQPSPFSPSRRPAPATATPAAADAKQPGGIWRFLQL